MARKVFAVMLDGAGGANRQVEKRLRDAHTDVYRFSETIYLVSVELSVMTQDVAQDVGIKGPGRDASGVVFKLDGAYSGWTHKTLWEWLSSVEAS